jgi:CHAT domain-containing protein/tetratricopeptide (TPR) repeat protein
MQLSGFLQTAKVLVFCLVAIPLAGPGSRSISILEAASLTHLPNEPTDSFWHAALVEGSNLYSAGRYDDAVRQFDHVSKLAAQAHNPRMSARGRGNVGAAQLAMHQYRAALSSFLSARHLADAAGDTSELAILDANLTSLCNQTGDLEEESRWIQGALDGLTGTDRREHYAQIEIQFATVRARQKRMPEAVILFRQGIEAAAQSADWALYAIGWNRLGEEYLELGELSRAEGPLLEAYRVRTLRHLPLDTSYRDLGQLRLEQGDLDGASVLLSRAIEISAQLNGPIPSWYAYHYRGRVRLAQGRLEEALADLRVAVRLARAWRWSMPPEDGMRMGAESWLDRVHSALMDAGNRLYLQTGDTALIRETFEAAEENRASSLRALVKGRRAAAESLPPSYWAALLRLQRAEVLAVRSPTTESEDAVLAARSELAQIEASSDSGLAPPLEDLLGRTRARLDRDTAVLGFHVDKSASWMWAVDRDGIELYRLPPIETLNPLIEAALQSIRGGGGDSTAGAVLYQALFGLLAPRFQRKSHWLLALDDALFQVPFSALPVPALENSPSKIQFMVERRSVEIIPGVAYWLARDEAPARRPDTPLFLGVGDPIYNSADPRLAKTARTAASFFDLLAPAPPPLPRLVASAAELDACVRAWKGNRILLEGASASRNQIEMQLNRHPDVLHFATHFVPSSEREPQGTIALSLTGRGVAETLQPAEIASWRTGARLVTLSGCNSAEGAVLPGTGLLGLNRAWLAAGARNVISSRWAVPDDSGSLFAALYRNLGPGGLPPAEALRAAQLEMLRLGGWRARPQYWGAYFAMGKE